jgi:hypothetical protein
MRFAGALSILAFTAGSAAFGQDAPNKDAEKDAQIDALQKQVDSVQKQLDAMRAGNGDGTTTPAADPRLDGAVRQSPVDPTADPRRLNISAPGIEGIDLFGGMAMRGERKLTDTPDWQEGAPFFLPDSKTITRAPGAAPSTARAVRPR